MPDSPIHRFKPRWFRDAEGRVRLVYELKLTNGFPVPVTVASVSVRDVERGRTIERLSGDELSASMTLLASPTEPETTVPAYRNPPRLAGRRRAEPAPGAGGGQVHAHRHIEPVAVPWTPLARSVVAAPSEARGSNEVAGPDLAENRLDISIHGEVGPCRCGRSGFRL